MIFCREIDEAAGLEILDHTTVTVQKYESVAGAAFDVMETNAVHLEKFAGGWIINLRLLREMSVDQGRYRQGYNRNRCGGRIWTRLWSPSISHRRWQTGIAID
jgi:hypothetical protein